jgi:hypothetical protein
MGGGRTSWRSRARDGGHIVYPVLQICRTCQPSGTAHYWTFYGTSQLTVLTSRLEYPVRSIATQPRRSTLHSFAHGELGANWPRIRAHLRILRHPDSYLRLFRVFQSLISPSCPLLPVGRPNHTTITMTRDRLFNILLPRASPATTTPYSPDLHPRRCQIEPPFTAVLTC